jgi:pilus assembly protein TadC
MTGLSVLLAVAAVLLWPSRGRAGSAPAAVPAGRPYGAAAAPAASPRPEDVADALVLVVLALRSGADLAGAVGGVAAVSQGAVRRDLDAVVAALRWGVPVAEAWGYAGHVWRPAALAFQMAAGTGASPTGLLVAAGARIRDEQEQDQARRAARAGVLLVLPLGLGFLPAFACTAVVPVVLALAASVLGSSAP